jgi:Family of unknown function (DUF6499)
MQNRGLASTIAPQDHRAAISYRDGETHMSEFNWRSSDAFYERAEETEITGFAWECLRRNPGFRRDHGSASPASRIVSPEVRDRWGLAFRS